MVVNIYSFLLPWMAGLSTLFGTIIIFFKYKNQNVTIINTLAFASGVMLSISIIELLPESYKLLNIYLNSFSCILIVLCFLCIGSIITFYIHRKLEGKGSNLYNIGLISMIAIILHNIPEGMITYIATASDLKLGISLTLAIMFHNIPEGISISIPIYYATKKKSRAVICTLISALSEPLGAFLTHIFFKNYINNVILSILYAIIAGIMINIAIYELLPESLSYKKKKNTYFLLIIGILITLIAHTIIN